MIIEYYDTYEYREQLLLLMDSDSKLQFLAAATFLGGHSLIVTLYNNSHLKKLQATYSDLNSLLLNLNNHIKGK